MSSQPLSLPGSRATSASRTLPNDIDGHDPHENESVWHAVAVPIRRGVLLIAFFFGALGSWSYFAPLDGGAVAPGIVSPDGSKKTVQHLEGGIIAKLNVRDGDRVKAGQALVTLENIQSRSLFDSLLHESRTLSATRSRLEAEKRGSTELEFPSDLLTITGPEMQRVLDDQRHLFTARLETFRARQSVLHQRIAQLEKQMQGYEAQVQSAETQLGLIAEEVRGKSQLLAQNLIAKPEVLKLERAQAEIAGRRGEYLANMARAMQQIGETRSQLLTIEAERLDQVANSLDDTRRRIAEVDQKLDSVRDVLQRTIITAPTDGVVINMKFKSEGGVVTKGEPILDIVPANDVLLIDARVSPNDIDIVRAGLPALVHLTAYSGRSTPRVNGAVRLVSADRLVDEATKQPFFLVRVEVAKEEVERLTPKVELLPGMPADVMIVTERRTLFEYMLQPFLDAWRRSFREA
jgi:HlyD family secretion protein